jgi:hypothetical protein
VLTIAVDDTADAVVGAVVAITVDGIGMGSGVAAVVIVAGEHDAVPAAAATATTATTAATAMQ